LSKRSADASNCSGVSLQILISPQRTRRPQRIREVVHDSPNTMTPKLIHEEHEESLRMR